MRSKLLIVCFAVTIAVTGLARAGFPTPSTSAASEASGLELMRLFQSLDLAPEQKRDIAVIINDHRPDIRAEVDRLVTAREIDDCRSSPLKASNSVTTTSVPQ